MDFITVPENISNQIPIVEGETRAILTDIKLGKSKSGFPKETIIFTLQDELQKDDNKPSTIGANVLDTCSLQPQALFAVNNYYEAVSGEQIPPNNYSLEDFHELLVETLVNTDWILTLKIEKDFEGKDRTVISEKQIIP